MTSAAAASFEPAYLALHRSGELRARSAAAVASLANCQVCPRQCGVDRLSGQSAVCGLGRQALVARAEPSFAGEACLCGPHGSGLIFFAGCNLRCVFCDSHAISQARQGRAVSAEELAAHMLDLQARGCANLQLATPEPVIPHILEALELAVARGLRLPLVYNSSGYDSILGLSWLAGVVDIYLPDFKIWDSGLSLKYLRARDYAAAARAALAEMHRQVGPLMLDENGLARRGLLVRHLVLPGQLSQTRSILRMLAPHTALSLRLDYQPAYQVAAGQFPELNRPLTDAEKTAARALAEREKLRLVP